MPDTITLTDDALLGGQVALRQPSVGYRVAIDPVLLAATIPAAPGQRVLDIGCGVGAASLCLASRVPGLAITGIEREPDLVQIATENAELNGHAHEIVVLACEIARPPPRLAPGAFDHAMANPPYFEAGRGRAAADPLAQRAMIEDETTLESWIRFCLTMVRPGGSVTLIHRVDRLPELLTHLGQRAGDLVVYPLWSHNPFASGRVRRSAKRVIVQGRVGSRGPLRLAGGLVVHEADGRYTHRADNVLRRGGALDLAEADETA